jgi:hypothetical protein
MDIIDTTSVVRRLEWEFDEVVLAQELEAGEVYEGSKIVLDIIIISHIDEKKTDNGSSSFDCPICYEEIADTKRVTISCGHNFCMSCTVDLVKSCNQEPKNVSCPMCRYPCFLLETPDKGQFAQLSEFLDEIQDANQEREDLNLINAFLYYHFMNYEEQVYSS